MRFKNKNSERKSPMPEPPVSSTFSASKREPTLPPISMFLPSLVVAGRKAFLSAAAYFSLLCFSSFKAAAKSFAERFIRRVPLLPSMKASVPSGILSARFSMPVIADMPKVFANIAACEVAEPRVVAIPFILVLSKEAVADGVNSSAIKIVSSG